MINLLLILHFSKLKYQNMNKDIQLFGMGNGLVDLQYNISEDTMSDFGMLKGEMHLIDDEERSRIIHYFKNYKYNICSGGSAANSIIAFSQLGGKAAYSTVLGDDLFGNFYASEFSQLGIILDAELLPEKSTGTCYVFIAPDSERTMLTYLGATALFSPKNVSEELIKRSQWIYIEGYKFSQQSSTEAVNYAMSLAKKHNTKIAFTFSDVFITENFRSKVEAAFDQADLIFCNENEAKSFTKETEMDKAIKSIFDRINAAVITKGSEGSIIKYGDEIINIPPYAANPIDSTGAGDMFAGAFLYGLIQENDLTFAGHLASLCGAKIVSKLGARMDEDFHSIVNEIKQITSKL